MKKKLYKKTNHTKKHKLKSTKECLLFSKQCFAHTAITVFNLKQYNTRQEKNKINQSQKTREKEISQDKKNEKYYTPKIN